MKTKLISAFALAIPAFAGTASPVVTYPDPAQIGAPAAAAAAVTTAATASAWAVEIGPTYRWATKKLFSDDWGANEKVDTIGADVTLIYNVNENHSFNVRFGYDYGNFSESITEDDGIYFDQEEVDYEMHNIYIMPGYRYTGELCDSVSWYVGANAGVSRIKVKEDYTFTEKYNGVLTEDCENVSASKKDWGFAASAELGLQYHLTDSVYLYGAYQYWMSSAKINYVGSSTKKQHYHSVKAGVGIKF